MLLRKMYGRCKPLPHWNEKWSAAVWPSEYVRTKAMNAEMGSYDWRGTVRHTLIACLITVYCRFLCVYDVCVCLFMEDA